MSIIALDRTTTTAATITTTTDNNDCTRRRSSSFVLQSPRCAANCLQYVRSSGQGAFVCKSCNTSSAYHVQRVVCHVVQRDSSAIKFDRVEIAFILALLYWLKHEGGEETGVPGENP